MAKMVLEKGHEKQPRRSTEKPSAWELGGLSVAQLAKRVWTSMDAEHDDTFGRAAQLAFWFFLAVFPGLVFFVTLLGLIAGKNPALQNALFSYIAQAMPPSAWQLMQHTLTEITKSAGGWKLVLGLLGALWSASSGVSSLITVLNFAYHVKERRSYIKTRLVIAPLLTVALAALMLAALGIVLFGGMSANWAGQHGLGDTAVIAWKILQWPIALFFVVLSFAVLYYWGPDVEDQKWYWITPGSLIGVGLWIAVSLGFRVYLYFFNSYTSTYGSLGAVIVLMMWFYISSLALLVGAEINTEIEQAAAEHGRADAKLKGEKEAPAA
ncbi:MAG: YihY/virulence factor BrkB family protein [Terriglobales bacterium]